MLLFHQRDERVPSLFPSTSPKSHSSLLSKPFSTLSFSIGIDPYKYLFFSPLSRSVLHAPYIFSDRSLFSVCLDAPCSSISWKSSVLSTCRSFFPILFYCCGIHSISFFLSSFSLFFFILLYVYLCIQDIYINKYYIHIKRWKKKRKDENNLFLPSILNICFALFFFFSFILRSFIVNVKAFNNHLIFDLM